MTLRKGPELLTMAAFTRLTSLTPSSCVPQPPALLAALEDALTALPLSGLLYILCTALNRKLVKPRNFVP